jgi:hypothetical protein
MKTKFLWLAVFVFLVLNFILLYKFKKVDSENKHIQENYFEVKQAHDNFKNVIGYFFQEDGKMIKNETCVTDSGVKVNLHKVISSTNRALIFRYSMSDCSDCVYSVLSKLSKASNIDKIIVIADFKSVPSMRFLKEKFNLQNAVFLKSSMEDVLATPCVFLSDRELKITKFLIIHQGDTILDNYLRIL